MSDWKGYARYVWYQTMAVFEDEEIQKRGVVEVLNVSGEWKLPAGQ